jgi:thioredoxin reductase
MFVTGRLLTAAIERARANAEAGEWPPSSMRQLAEARYEDRLHPRDRVGRWADVLDKLASPGRTEGPKPGQHRTVEALRGRWAELDRALLPYAGHAEAPEARDIVRKQQLISKLIHHRSIDEGGPEGVGEPGGPVDVLVIGAGPAGLQAAINGGAEGLDTLLIDPNTEPGGQAGLSSRIENLMGFPTGVTGEQLAKQSYEQALRLGARAELGVSATGLEYDPGSGMKTVALSDGRKVKARAVVLAGGVQFRKIDFPGADSPDIVYGNSKQLKLRCGKGDAVIVGGANSAAQAAVDVSNSGAHKVTLLVRHKVDARMSKYMLDQLRSDPKIEIVEDATLDHAKTGDDGRVTGVVLKDGRELPATAIGLFIGSAPSAKWADLDLDERGFVKVGGEGREYLESSVPGVFAAGDIRASSNHRVASAVGDGTLAIAEAWGRVKEVGHRKVSEAADPRDDEDSPEIARPGQWADIEREAAAIPDDEADRSYAALLELDAEQPYTGGEGE